MFPRISLIVVLLAAVPLWSQQSSQPEGSNDTASAPSSTSDDLHMVTPPPVSGATYPTETISEARSNYLRGGLTFNSTYTDNLLGGSGTKPVSDISYSVWPILALDQATPRMHLVLTYSPGFTFYQHTSSYNQENQNADIDFRYRLSPHVTLSLRDTLHKLSNVFNQPDLLASSPVSGLAQSSSIGIVAPLADQLNNAANVELTYQFARDSMAGVSGLFTNLDFSNPDQVKGLYDSASRGGSAFYSHRLAKKHYLGAAYQFQQILAYPTVGQSQLQTQTAFLFYTAYLKPTLSLSFSGGPQHSDIVTPSPSSESWSPAAAASFGWQARHTVISSSYSRMVSGGGGLIGAYHSNNAAVSLRQQFTRNWNAGVTGAYSLYKTVDPLLSLFNQGGHTVTGSATLQRRFGQSWNTELGYTRLHQSYSDIAAVSVFPNVNREWISITYQFAKPLGQ